jgi:hypothetical protein
MPKGRRDYLPQFLDTLQKRRGVMPRETEAFTIYWHSLPDPIDELACPFCFVVGQQGRMVEQTKVGDTAALRCRTCSEQILIRI